MMLMVRKMIAVLIGILSLPISYLIEMIIMMIIVNDDDDNE